MTTFSYNSRLSFGKYKDRLISDILILDISYLKYLLKQGIKFDSYTFKLLTN